MAVIGERVNNRYEIKALVGTGGMAKVYLAHDVYLKRDVAVKLLANSFIDDEDSIKRFKREAASTTELSHENIVSIYDVGEDDNPFIVMEYIGGTDLKTYIKNNHPISNEKVVSIMDKILSAIAYAHSRGVVHRDIKPQNILIDNDGTVKITDFGIALAISQHSITQTNSLLGTVHYMSPEQAKGGMATRKSDIYSLGIVMYELLTGQVPFNGESPVSIALKHFQEDLQPIQEQNDQVPQALENVVLKATTKEATMRYNSVSEMQEDLRTALDPTRADEARFVPSAISESETIVMDPVKPPQTAESGDQEDTAVYAAPQNKRDNRPLWIIALVLLIPFVLIGALLLYIWSSGPEEVEVPDLTAENVTVEEARDILDELDLEVGDIIEEPNEDIDEGYVTRTNPSAGATIRQDQAVDLYVSSGGELFTLEDYEGEPFEETRAILTELGFTVESNEVNHNEIESGHIVSQDTRAGLQVIPDETTITFDVSAGPAGFNFRDLTGYTRVGVDDYVEENNLNLTVDYRYSDDVEEGLVMGQDPAPGTTLYEGSNVTVIFSEGPEEPEYESFTSLVQVQYEPVDGEDGDEEEPTPNEIEIFIDDAENNMDSPVLSFEITEDVTRTLNFTVESGDTARYRVVRDGETVDEGEVSNDNDDD